MAVEPLPRGRHRLSREQVERSQRGRMLAAMTDAVAEKGYVATTVAGVLARAHVARAPSAPPPPPLARVSPGLFPRQGALLPRRIRRRRRGDGRDARRGAR